MLVYVVGRYYVGVLCWYTLSVYFVGRTVGVRIGRTVGICIGCTVGVIVLL
jgi:hypothetical protein